MPNEHEVIGRYFPSILVIAGHGGPGVMTQAPTCTHPRVYRVCADGLSAAHKVRRHDIRVLLAFAVPFFSLDSSRYARLGDAHGARVVHDARLRHGPRSIATPGGGGGPSSWCEVGEGGGVWKAKGRTLFSPVANENGW